MTRRNRIIAAAVAALSIRGATLLAAGAELYGRPLRGLTPVAISEVLANPQKYRDRTIRLAGVARSSSGSELVAEEGEVAVTVRPDGSFNLPEDARGARVAAEGRVQVGEKGTPFLLATGVEITR